MNWWRLCFEPIETGRTSNEWRMAHELPAIGRGYVWPPVAVAGDGHSVHFREVITRTRRSVNSLQFLTTLPEESVSRADFESESREFIRLVVARLEALNIASDLSEIFEIVSEEQRDASVSRERIFEALLGCDVDEGDPQELAFLDLAAHRIGVSAIEEVAVASKRGRVAKTVDDLHRALEGAAKVAEIEDFSQVKRVYDENATRFAYPWQRGYAAADLTRRYFHLPSGRLPDKTLSELFGTDIKSFAEPATRATAVFGVAARSVGKPLRAILNSPTHTSTRFDVSRMLGDHAFVAGDDV